MSERSAARCDCRGAPRLSRVVPALLASALIAVAAPAPAGAALTLVPVGTFNSPDDVEAPPGDAAHVYVAEQDGTVQVLENGASLPMPFLDISSRVASSGEQGLLAIAFPPDYAQTGFFYAYYTANDGANTLARFHATSPEHADPTPTVMLSIPHDRSPNENGGGLAFGPDGYLYLGTGDAGDNPDADPTNNAQTLGPAPPSVQTVDGTPDNHDPRLGKILRLDLSGASAVSPADNPFAAGGGDPEVWSYGLHNPYRLSFDSLTGDLTVADVGYAEVEEVDYEPAPNAGRGLNFGWRVKEGDQDFDGSAGPLSGTYAPPVITHDHTHSSDSFCAVIGGDVVRDPALPSLAGRYVYGDFCNNSIYAATLGPGGASGDGPISGISVPGLSSFGTDGCGRLYATSINGPVYRFAEAGSCFIGGVQVTGTGGGDSTTPAPGATTSGGGTSGSNSTRSSALRLVARSVRATQHPLTSHHIVVRAGCALACTLHASGLFFVVHSAHARAAAALPLVPARATVRAGHSATLVLVVGHALRHATNPLLARHRHVAAIIHVRATSAKSTAATVTLTIPLAR